MNMVALVDGQPRLLNLKQMLDCFLSHRREVITRRTVFELRKARERAPVSYTHLDVYKRQDWNRLRGRNYSEPCASLLRIR